MGNVVWLIFNISKNKKLGTVIGRDRPLFKREFGTIALGGNIKLSLGEVKYWSGQKCKI